MEDSLVKMFDIQNASLKYKKMIDSQYIYIKSNIDKIISNVEKLLEKNKKNEKNYQLKNCCNFKKLEIELENYLKSK